MLIFVQNRWQTCLVPSAPAVALWLAVGFSLGWYYTFTYYGVQGWPMPSIEPCAALILYYFSVLNVDTELQAIHWMLVFPAAGALWVAALSWVARRLGMAPPAFGRTYLRFAWAALPLALPGPIMAYLAGQMDGRFVWQRMINVALRRGNVSPWPWLTPLYVGLGLLALSLSLYVYRVSFRTPAGKAWVHYPVSAILLTLLSCLTGAAIGLPLRLLLE